MKSWFAAQQQADSSAGFGGCTAVYNQRCRPGLMRPLRHLCNESSFWNDNMRDSLLKSILEGQVDDANVIGLPAVCSTIGWVKDEEAVHIGPLRSWHAELRRRA